MVPSLSEKEIYPTSISYTGIFSANKLKGIIEANKNIIQLCNINKQIGTLRQ
jgi:hypothetical protein